MKHKNLLTSFLAFLILVFIMSTPVEAKNNWQSIGYGTLVDGWFTQANAESKPLTVEIEVDQDVKGRYRILHPYKNLQEITGIKNTSAYKETGSIVFNISDPEWVILETDEFAGFTNESIYFMGLERGTEYKCTNAYGFYLSKVGGNGSEQMAKNMVSKDSESTYDSNTNTVKILKPVITNSEASMNPQSAYTAYIHFPEGYDTGIKVLTPEEKEIDEGNWTSLGIGKFIDGWVTDGLTFDVEIQQHNSNPNRYRVWEPYKDLEKQTGFKNESTYHGQIIFDVTYPEYVHIVADKPIGYYYSGSETGYPAEMCAANEFGVLYAANNGDVNISNPAFLNFLKGWVDDDPKHKTTFEDGVITIVNSAHLPPNGKESQMVFTDIQSKIILPKPLSESEIWEIEEGQWNPYGTGQLVDGWVSGETYDVEIQQDVNNLNRFRVWEPFKNVDGNASEYHGQIVFDITDPRYVHIEQGKPMGYKKADGLERYAVNDYGFYYTFLGHDPSLIKSVIDNTGDPTTFINGVVIEEVAKYREYTGSDFGQMIPTNNAAKIIMPKFPANWEIVSEEDYFDFSIDNQPIEVNYNSDSKSYKLENIRETAVVKAAVKPEFVSYLIESVTSVPTGGEILIDDNAKGFSIYEESFQGTYKFTANLIPVQTNWEIISDGDYFTFTQNNEPLDATYNASTNSYTINNIEESSVLTVKLRQELNDYKISNVNILSFETGSSSVFRQASAQDSELERETLEIISADGKSFQLVMNDYVGTYKFGVELEYVGSLIVNIAEPAVSVTQNTAYIRINYDSSLVPEGCIMKTFYGSSEIDTDSYEDYVNGLASGVSFTVSDLMPETEYEYNAVFKIYNADGEEISVCDPILVKFKTSREPIVDSATTAADYLWDTTSMPENEYAIFTYYTYKLGQNGYPQFKPQTEVVKGIKFQKAHENGVRELTLHFAHLLPKPPVVTDDENMLVKGKWFILKNPSDERENLFGPASPSDWDNQNGANPYGYTNVNGEKFEGGLTGVFASEISSNDGGLTDYIWAYDKINYFELKPGKKVYNIIVVIGFDENDDKYETPKYVKISYEEEPVNAITGTITQTSAEFDSDKDKAGGWQTWIHPVATGDSENPYPYVYDFIAREEVYDMSFTFSNGRLLNVKPEDIEGRSFHPLLELDPHSMVWNSDFETPVNWNSKTKGREIRAQQTNYYPGYVGPHTHYMSGYAPSFIESIKLTDLIPGHHYQIVFEHPSYGWEPGGNDPVTAPIYVENYLGYITLIDFDIAPGEIGAYQLVEDTKDENVYYTYDIKGTGKTYKLKLDDKDEVLSYEEVTNIVESATYIDSRYKFTDKIFVFATGYGLENVAKKEISVNVLNAEAEVNFAEGEERRPLEVTNEGVKLGTVYRMKGQTFPLDEKTFNIEKYKLTLQRGYKTCQDNVFELFETDRPVTHRGYFDYVNKVDKAERKYDPETIKIKDISTKGQLVVPEPMSHNPEYVLSTEHVVTPANGEVIKIRLYADDLKPEGQSYLEKEYTLSGLQLHSHDFHVKFPYEMSNVTDDLGAIMDTPRVLGTSDLHFNLYVTGDNSSVPLDPTNYNDLGFFNADLGDIYEIDQNRGATASRKLELSVTPAGYPYIYKRWSHGETAQVHLDLTEPNISEITGSQAASHIYHGVRQCDDGNWEEYFALRGVDIINTSDEIIGSEGTDQEQSNGLVNGDSDSQYTTLYLLEPYQIPQRKDLAEYGGSYNSESASLTGEKILLTKEEIMSMEFDIVTSERMSLEAWKEKVQQDKSYLLNEKNVKSKVLPFRLRNVYLFPITNDGLKNEGDAELFSTPRKVAVYSDADAADEPTYAYENWHGVTTPVKEVNIDLSTLNNKVVTGVEEIQIEADDLARAGNGVIEVLAEGAVLYGTDGLVLGNGTGIYPARHGVYIVRKGAQVQKLFVK